MPRSVQRVRLLAFAPTDPLKEGLSFSTRSSAPCRLLGRLVSPPGNQPTHASRFPLLETNGDVAQQDHNGRRGDEGKECGLVHGRSPVRVRLARKCRIVAADSQPANPAASHHQGSELIPLTR